MAATPVAVHDIGRGAAALNLTDITGDVGNTVDGMTVANDGRTIVLVKNTNGTSTAHSAGATPIVSADSGSTSSTVTKSIAAGKEFVFGPYPTNIYGSTLKMTADHAELTFRALRLPA